MKMSINYDYARATTYNFRQRFLILHYTAGDFKSSIQSLTHNLSVHYLVSLNQKDDPSYPFDKAQIFNLVNEQDRAWHVGVSAFQDRVNLNDTSIGIEIINLVKSTEHFLPYPDYQIDLVVDLCQNIIARFPDITPERVLGHSDVAFDRKSDPGPLFPWKKLYDAGVGAWYDQSDVAYFKSAIESGKYSAEQAFEKIQAYGYSMDNQRYRCPAVNRHNLVKAFQMHFRPSNYDGNIDTETAAIMLALYYKYTATSDDPIVQDIQKSSMSLSNA